MEVRGSDQGPINDDAVDLFVVCLDTVLAVAEAISSKLFLKLHVLRRSNPAVRLLMSSTTLQLLRERQVSR